MPVVPDHPYADAPSLVGSPLTLALPRDRHEHRTRAATAAAPAEPGPSGAAAGREASQRSRPAAVRWNLPGRHVPGPRHRGALPQGAPDRRARARPRRGPGPRPRPAGPPGGTGLVRRRPGALGGGTAAQRLAVDRAAAGRPGARPRPGAPRRSTGLRLPGTGPGRRTPRLRRHPGRAAGRRVRRLLPGRDGLLLRLLVVVRPLR